MYILASSFENPQFKSITRLIVFRQLFDTLTLKTFITNIMRYSPIPWAVLGFQYVYKYLLCFLCVQAITGKGGRYLEAQVQGSKTEAEEGTLVILAAGDRSLFDDCQSCFEAMGKNSFYLGNTSSAHMGFDFIRIGPEDYQYFFEVNII